MNNIAFKEYNNIYKTYIGSELDKNFITNWYKSNTEKNRSTQLFKNYLLNSDLYYATIYKRIQKIYSVYITTPLSDDFVKKFIQSIRDEEVTEEKIFSFIVRSNEYKEFNSNLIENFYKYLTGKNCRAETKDKYMENFKNKSYSYELLHKQIVEDEGLQEDKIEQIKKEHLSLKGSEASLKSILNILEKLKDNNCILKSLIVNDSLFDNETLYKFINKFNSKYNRDIHVLEFIKYYPELCIEKQTDLDTSIKDINEVHKEKYSTVKNLYQKYLSADLDEKKYLVLYIKLVDSEDYINQIIDDLIEKDEYKNLMKDRISNIFEEHYSKTISDFDLTYCFAMFKSKKYNLQESLISEDIVTIYDLTKKYSTELSKIYTKLLKREADISEYQKCISKYRDNNDIETTNNAIINEILESLEYQMILRDIISQMYEEIHEEKAIPSVIYAILADILGNQTECKNDDDKLRELITNFKKPNIL